MMSTRTNRAWGARVVALATSLALGTGLITLSVTGIVAASATTPACTAANLVIWLNTEGSGAAGSSYYDLNFTNVSRHACTLEGYPRVWGVSSAGEPLGSAAGRSTTHRPGLITLAAANPMANSNGQSASAIIQITVAGNFPSTSCPQIVAAGLRVVAPIPRHSQFVPFPFNACAKRGPVYLHVGAIGRFQSQP